MICAVFSVVNVMKHGSCPQILSKIEPFGYLSSGRQVVAGLAHGCSTWNKSSRQNVKYGTGSSPSCISVLEKSMDLRSNRGGVPVFSLPSSKPSSFRDDERLIAAASPARPPDCWFDPTCISPRKKVPVVI